MVSAGAMLLDQFGPPGFRFNDFEAPRYPFITLYARADGQAVVCPLLRGSSPTRGVAPKQHRGLGRAFTPAFRAGSLSLNPWRVGAEESAAARMVSAGAMLLDRLGPPGSEFRFIDFRPPRFALLSASRLREGAAGQAVVCPLLRGSSPTRGVAPKQHRGLGRAFTPAFRAGSLSLNPWRVGAEESGAARMVSAGAMLLDRLGPPGSEFRFIDFRAPRFAL